MTPQRLGPYLLDELLGAGAMGRVYLARDTRHHDRSVALKLLPESFGSDREFMARFEREARITAQLSEPHVIPVHSYGAIEGQPYIEMRLVSGSDLQHLLQDIGGLPAERAVALIAQAAAALDAAHAAGLVHRDVKPSNLLVTPDDFLYVVDFGIAHPLGTGNTVLTATGATVGTLQYMAPERFLGTPVDGRTDVYSLTCVLYECLTGEPPFRGEELPALLYAHVTLPPPRPTGSVRDLPSGMDEVVARGMAKDPDERFPTAGALAAAAAQVLRARRSGTPPTVIAGAAARPTLPPRAAVSTGTPSPPPPRPASSTPAVTTATSDHNRRRAAVIAGVIALVLVLPLTVIYLTKWRDEGNAAAGSTPSASAVAEPSSPLASVQTPSLVQEITGSLVNPHDIVLSPDGTRAYVADGSAGALQVLDVDRRRVIRPVPIPLGPPQYVSLSPEGDRAYVTTSSPDHNENSFSVIDLSTDTVVHSEPVDPYPLKPTVSPDGKRVYVPLHDQGKIEVFDALTGSPVDEFAVPENPHSIVLSADGTTGYVADHESGLVSVWDMATLRQSGELPAGDAPHRVALSPNGSQLAVVNFQGNDVWLYDTAGPSDPRKIPVGAHPQDVAYAPDGRHLYTVNLNDDSLSVVDVASGEVTPVPTGNEPTSIVLRADGSEALVTVSAPPDGAPPGQTGNVSVLRTAG